VKHLLSGVAVIAALAVSSPIGAYVLARIDRPRWQRENPIRMLTFQHGRRRE
jgi:hypothetical protein